MWLMGRRVWAHLAFWVLRDRVDSRSYILGAKYCARHSPQPREYSPLLINEEASPESLSGCPQVTQPEGQSHTLNPDHPDFRTHIVKLCGALRLGWCLVSVGKEGSLYLLSIYCTPATFPL